VKISTTNLPPAQSRKSYNFQLEAVGGSGEYHFTSSGLPLGLTLSADGEITGTPNVDPSSYTVKITLIDVNFENNYVVTEFNLDVLLLSIDEYEPDNTFPNEDSANIIAPGDEAQIHTFHQSNDIDYVILDLLNVERGYLVTILTTYISSPATITVQLFDAQEQVITSVNNDSDESQSILLYTCENPGIYYLKIFEFYGYVGDYELEVSCGPEVKITTLSLPDSLREDEYTFKVIAQGGGGEYIFSATGLPTGLTMYSDGTIYGVTTAPAGAYSVTITAIDKSNTANKITIGLNIDVFDFYPDDFEPNNSIEAAITILPNEEQNHNFNNSADVDYIKVDLTGITIGDVIIFETKHLTKETDTTIVLYNESRQIIESNNNDGDDAWHAKIIRSDLLPAIYYIKVENTNNIDSTGDYTFIVTNGGQKIEIITEDLAYAESSAFYNTKISSTGGSVNLYTIQSGNLPGGLNLDQHTGQITGMNFEYGTFEFSIKAFDSDYPENYDIKNLKITAYDGRKVIASDIMQPLSWTTQDLRTGTSTFYPTVQASHTLAFVEYEFPEELNTWKVDTYYTINGYLPKYTFNQNSGVVKMLFINKYYDYSSGYYPNDTNLIRNANTGEWRTHTITYKVYDTLYPDNYDIFSITVEMEIN